MNKYFYIALEIWSCAVIPLVFAEDFQNRPTLSGLNETVNQAIACGHAIEERDEAVGWEESFMPYYGLGQSYFVSLQQELEILATIYIDHENGPLTGEEDGFLYFDLNSWRAAAGLNASGFRRSTDGSSFSYGQMQSDDIIGPWLFDDLREGFGALKWIAGSLNWTAVGGGSMYYVEHGYPPLWSDAVAGAEALWPGGNVGGTPQAFTQGSYWYSSETGIKVRFYAWGSRSKVTPNSVTLSVPHTVVFYIRGEKNGTDTSYIKYTYSSHGDEISESASFYVKETSGEETGTIWTGTTIGSSSLPTWCSEPGQPTVPGNCECLGYTSHGIVLVKYNFTNE